MGYQKRDKIDKWKDQMVLDYAWLNALNLEIKKNYAKKERYGK